MVNDPSDRDLWYPVEHLYLYMDFIDRIIYEKKSSNSWKKLAYPVIESESSTQ